MNGLTIFTTTHCGPCRQAKARLQARGIPFNEVNLDHRPELLPWLQQMTGQNTVPQFFWNETWLRGGLREAEAWFAG